MESDRTPRDPLAAAERAGAAPYVDYPPTPWWYFPAAGAWAASMVVAIGQAGERPGLTVGLVLVLVAAEVAFIGWYRRYRGTMPSFSGVPAEVARAMGGFAVGAVVVVAVVVAATVWAGVLAGAALAFVGVTAGLVAYERRYEAAARATRERLA
ncbi:hypothetical protein [Iamia sp.]|uniref:hypothetical protein n=1 Tax=Iamia sp. TaxID=2722710 RepID=UPI002C07DC06|nr:hypothetical protein [Iamia sp.]HXH56004.1 hypothetical protein [Iamia sp.]